MRNKLLRVFTILSLLSLMLVLAFSGCVGKTSASEPVQIPVIAERAAPERNTLTYLGHANLRIVTPEGKVIYVDPWPYGEENEVPADLILASCEFYDHTDGIAKIMAKNPGFRLISVREALEGGEPKVFEFDFVRVEVIRLAPAYYAVGYLLTLSNGKSIYVSGDVSKIDYGLAARLKERNLDYAFYSCSEGGVMRAEEASEYAALINAKHSIPYHTSADGLSGLDREYAEKFEAEGRMILEPGELISLGESRIWGVGEEGPAGGLVFYDKGNYSGGWRYLEAAPVSTEFQGIQWGADHTNCFGTEKETGTGKRNTEVALERLEFLGDRDCAPQLCAALEYNGFNDWFLPSIDELVLMYVNLKQRGLGEFNKQFYWSSSRNVEYNPYGFISERYTLVQDFSSGGQTWYGKHYLPHSARAIRAF